MATISMNAVQFYDPSSIEPSLSARCAAALQKHRQSIGIPHRKQWSRVFESYNQSRNMSKEIVGKQDDPAGDDNIAAYEDDDLPLLEEVLRPTLHLEDSNGKPTDSALTTQGTDKTSLQNGSGSSMPAQSSLSGHLNGSKEQPIILDDDDDDDDNDNDDDDDDDDSNSTSGGGISSDSNTDGTGRELSPTPSPTTPYPDSRPSRDPSLHPSTTPRGLSLEDQAIQQDDGCISRELLEQPSCPALILSDDEDDETEKGQQHQESREDREQGACNSDTSSDSDVDDDNNHLQDNHKSEGLQPTKQRRLSPSYDPAIRCSRKQRLQHFDKGVSTTRPMQQQHHQEIAEEKEQETQQPLHLVSDDSDDSDRSEAPRPAKRRRPSPSNSDPTSNGSQKWRLQRPSKSFSRTPSKLDRSHTAPPQTQLKLSLNFDDRAQSQHSSAHSSTDDEQMSTTAEYREWPIHGFFKRTSIGNEIRYSMDFSLEQLQGLCAVACPLHATLPNSDRDFSIGPANLPKVSTRVKKTRSAPLSRSKRTPFTSKENTMLVDLKENKGWPWKRIEPKFPQRTLNSLQVHYCTKLKGKALTEGDDIE